MNAQKKYVRVISEKFTEVDTPKGRLIRTATELHNEKIENITSRVYEPSYILKKQLEYKKLVANKKLINATVEPKSDGYTYIYHFNKEIYKVENELFEIVKASETKEKLYKIFFQKRAKLKHISMIKQIGHCKTYVEIAKDSGLDVDYLQRKATQIKDLIIDNFDEFNSAEELSPLPIIREFYRQYWEYIDNLG